jgi:hypothetical protein
MLCQKNLRDVFDVIIDIIHASIHLVKYSTATKAYFKLFLCCREGSMMSSPQRWWGHVWASIFVVCEGPLLMGRTFDMLRKITLRGGRL